IAYGLGWPRRKQSGVPLLDLIKVGRLDFQAPDEARFPCLRLAREAMQTGQTASVVLNAANEIAVEAFLAGQLPFPAIARTLDRVMEKAALVEPIDLDTILKADAEARALAREQLVQYRKH
ncbi:MAG TPA: 1-deoxy-D-xylulose-5-phosphate reductoisomerase, partial [Candidatus Kapabacteria bacterium]|nr:1-deoxy-D-xylulose-5-phosphate reductoisomerase [Candidatus Kapabacteria bacterium]